GRRSKVRVSHAAKENDCDAAEFETNYHTGGCCAKGYEDGPSQDQRGTDGCSDDPASERLGRRRDVARRKTHSPGSGRTSERLCDSTTGKIFPSLHDAIQWRAQSRQR